MGFGYVQVVGISVGYGVYLGVVVFSPTLDLVPGLVLVTTTHTVRKQAVCILDLPECFLVAHIFVMHKSH